METGLRKKAWVHMHNGKIKELDATWNLYEGLPACHLFSSFGSGYGWTEGNFTFTQKIVKAR